MINCPHCSVPMFREDESRTKLKLGRSVVVLHKAQAEVEVNCPHCHRGVVLGTLGLSLRKAQPRLVVRPLG